MKEFDRVKYLPIFREEVSERICRITDVLLELEKGSFDKESFIDIQRQMHTLKSTALMLGFDEIGQIAHSLEDIFADIVKKESGVDTEFVNKVFGELDSFKLKLNRLTEEETATQRRRSELKSIEKLLKVPFKKFERLLILSLSASQEKGAIDNAIRTLKEYIQCLREQPSPLEIEKMRNQMRSLLKEFTDINERLGILISRLIKNVQEVRLVPLDSVLQDFPRVVRDISLEEKKEASLALEVSGAGIDELISDKVRECLIHIVRNSVKHGIEAKNEREKAGKNSTGLIKIKADINASEVCIEIEDDGAGICIDKIRDIVIDKALADKAYLDRLSDKEIARFIFFPGFSSSSSVDKLSGRGIGLDSVRESVEKLGGKIDIDFEEGKYARFTLCFPLTIGLVPILLVRDNEQNYGVPVNFLDEYFKVEPKDIYEDQGRFWLQLNNQRLPVVKLTDLLYKDSTHKSIIKTGSLWVCIVKYSNMRYAVIVDEALDKRDLVLKKFSSFLGKVKFLMGAGILTDNTICLALDMPEIFEDLKIRG